MTAVPPAPDPADRPGSEPLMTRAAAVAVAGAVLGLLVSLGVIHLTDGQTQAALTVAGIVLPLAAAWWGRRHVWSPRQVARLAAAVRRDAGRARDPEHVHAIRPGSPASARTVSGTGPGGVTATWLAGRGDDTA